MANPRPQAPLFQPGGVCEVLLVFTFSVGKYLLLQTEISTRVFHSSIWTGSTLCLPYIIWNPLSIADRSSPSFIFREFVHLGN